MDTQKIAQRQRIGTVHLVGAGPGDPELLTLRAARLLRECSAVVYDNLVGPGVLDMVNSNARRIYVGKESGSHTLPQEKINALLVELATEGLDVVRLKGGHPFIFGRGGEELERLVEHGIPCEVVPGITAASGMSACAGIPLTHRDFAQACIFVTGHLQDDSVDLDWPTLARPHQTIVVYMGIAALAEICHQLVRHGLPASTPAAIVRHATLSDQQIIVATLDSLPAKAKASGITSPSLIVIGEVVSLRARLVPPEQKKLHQPEFREDCLASPVD
ncbi:MAG: uroporphyrinogen-III C-methyltransferase [Azonexus sp.]|nr:uroporphyrinogen-III C-methyltransferase [Azonexus sp.]